VDPDPIVQEPEENVKVIKSDNSTILSTQSELDDGKYIIDFTGTVPTINVGDVIVGDNGEGYLREVTSVSSSSNVLTFSTSQATMEDLFKNEVFSMNADLSSKGNKNPVTEKIIINYMAKGVSMSADGFTFDFSDTEIYTQGPVTAKISSGQATFNPNFVFDFEFEDSELESFVFKAENASLGLNMEFLLNATSSVNLGSHEKELVDYQKIFTTFVGFVPVIITVNTKLVAKMTMDVDATFNLTTGFSNSNTVTLGASYLSGSWEGINSLNSNFTPSPLEMGGVVNLEQKISIVPEVSVRLYGVAGPYAIPEMYLANHVGVASPSLDWDASLSAGVDLEVGANATIFGESIVGFSKTYSSSQVLINAPDKIEVVSGSGQSGTQGVQLAEPIKVKVTDSFGKTWENVPIHFEVTQGGGSLETASVQTDSEGFAEVMWTLGSDGSEQKLKATIKKSDASVIGTVEFTATAAVNVELVGDLDFGSVAVNTSQTKELTIKNLSSSEVTISTITTPSGFEIDWTGGNIAGNGTKIVVVTFTPTDLTTYTGDIVVNESALIAVSGTGVNALLSLSGELNFGDVGVGTSKEAELTITNSGDVAINVSGIELPEGFTSDWSSGDIEAGTSKTVTLTFTPTVVQDYSGEVTVTNDGDQENNTIAISGTGIATTMALSGNMNFGNVIIDTSVNETLTITNNGATTINVSSISLPIGYTANWASGDISGGNSQEVTITFLPTAVQTYSGNIIVNNDTDQENNSMPVSGSGVDNVNNYEELIIGTWVLTEQTENGTSYYDPNLCDNLETEIYNGTQLNSTVYYDEDGDSETLENNCLATENIVSDYTIENGNFLYDTYEGDTDISEILVLNNTTLVLKAIDGSYTYVYTYTRQ